MNLYYTTFTNQNEAEHIGKTLVKEQLIKCMNILGEGKSVYEWQDKIEVTSEVYAILKSNLPLTKIEGRFCQLHSYDTPCIIELDIISASKAYAKWIEA